MASFLYNLYHVLVSWFRNTYVSPQHFQLISLLSLEFFCLQNLVFEYTWFCLQIWVLSVYWPCLQNSNCKLECASLNLVFKDFVQECELGLVALWLLLGFVGLLGMESSVHGSAWVWAIWWVLCFVELWVNGFV